MVNGGKQGRPRPSQTDRGEATPPTINHQPSTINPPEGILYVVATPIGNLEDLSFRALRVLREAALIAAEDTRHTRKLLARYEIRTPLVAYHAHSSAGAARRILAHLEAGEPVALVSDAGTPGISDPGAGLVAAAAAAGVRVVPVPGPSAAAAALSVAGLAPARFVFEGFLPRTGGERRRRLEALRADPRAAVFYEAPTRLVRLLESMVAVLGDRRVVVGRELTKQHEEIFRGDLPAALAHFRQAAPRGEVVLVLDGAPEAAPPADPDALQARAAELLRSGHSPRDAARQLAAECRVPRGTAYAATLRAVAGDEGVTGDG